MTDNHKWSVAELYSAIDYLDQQSGVFCDFVEGAEATKLEAMLGTKVAVSRTDRAVKDDFYCVYIWGKAAAQQAIGADLIDADPLEIKKCLAFDVFRRFALDWGLQ